MLNPLRSEDEAFRFLLYALAVIVVIVGTIVIVRAIVLARARRCYLTMRVPYIPAGRCPGASQKNV